jgi:hypothetical protein
MLLKVNINTLMFELKTILRIIRMTKCEHGKRKQICRDCGGSAIC